MGEFSLTHWLVIAVIAIIFFGPKRLPQLGASLGEGIRGFKKAMNDDSDKTQSQQQARPQSPPQTPTQAQVPRQPELPFQVESQDPVANARVVEETHKTTENS